MIDPNKIPNPFHVILRKNCPYGWQYGKQRFSYGLLRDITQCYSVVDRKIANMQGISDRKFRSNELQVLLATVLLITTKMSRSACQSVVMEQVSDADHNGTKFGGHKTSPTLIMIFESWFFRFYLFQNSKKKSLRETI